MRTARFLARSVRHTFETNLSQRELGTRKKILPECATPDLHPNSKVLSLEDKTTVILEEPRFGMMALTHYHWTHGHMLDAFERENRVYCSRVFSFALPILIFICQWIMYVSLLAHQFETYEDGICPNQATAPMKAMTFAICILYFVRSFYLWDQVVDRTGRYSMLSGWYTTLDVVQEFGFTLLVYWANLLITFTEPDLTNSILNALALEYICLLDNEIEELYLRLVPSAATEIWDKYFAITDDDDDDDDTKSNESKSSTGDIAEFSTIRSAKCSRCSTTTCTNWMCCLPWKILLAGHFLFPVSCLALSIFSAVCK